MRSSVTVAFTPRVLESLACVNTLFTSVLGLLSHTARSFSETWLVCWHAAPQCSPKVPSSGLCSVGGSVCQCHHTAGNFYFPLTWRRWFHSNQWVEAEQVKWSKPLKPTCCCSHVGTHECSIWPLWRGEREILPAPAEQVPVCPFCPRDCTASSKPAAARKLS